MNHLRYLGALLVTGLILALFVVSTVAATPPQGKTTICHSAGHKVVQITVSNSAVPAHMRHGDTLPDEYGDCL